MNGRMISGERSCQWQAIRHLCESHFYSTIHKATSRMVPGHSMTLPGTIPEDLLSQASAECWTVAL